MICSILDAAVFVLCLAAAACAECIPLLLILVSAAVGLTILKEVSVMYYRICPYCQAHLDSGERCDCQDKKGAAQGATNTQSGKRSNKIVTACYSSQFNEE